MRSLRPGGNDTRGIREGLLSATGSRRPPVGETSRNRGARVAVVAAAGLLLLAACTHSRGARDARTVKRDGVQAAWYTLTGGHAHPVAGPAAARFAPWTVQTRAAGFLSVASHLYIAVNGWGLLELRLPAAARAEFRSFENRRLFAERTINGFTVDSGTVVLHLYHNTVLATKPPSPTPVSYARFDTATHLLTPVALRPSLEGWEAAEVVTTAAGRWAMAWKKTLPRTVEFRYSIFDPASGRARAIDRDSFVAAYDFLPVSTAPRAVRQLAGIAAALAAPPGSSGSGGARVVHLLLRGAPFERTVRYSEGPERELASGNAALVTVPALRAGGRLYALISGGRLLRSGGAAANAPAQRALLPALPRGFAYTDFWTDGRTVVASWEQQRFAQVGGAGICVVAVADLRWQGA